MVRLVTKDLPNLEVTTFEGLWWILYGTAACTILRGLQAISFRHEFQMALVNRKLAETVETVF